MADDNNKWTFERLQNLVFEPFLRTIINWIVAQTSLTRGVIASMGILLIGFIVLLRIGPEPGNLIAEPPPESIRPPFQIAFLFPNPDMSGAPYQDGRVQRDGFRAGIQMFKDDFRGGRIEEPLLRVYTFEHTYGELSLGDRLLDQMKSLYENEMVRVFVLTMSSAIEAVKSGFITWRRKIKSENENVPILIATVASAPQLADLENGIYRIYIRSTEESAAIADYFHTIGIDECSVIYITRTVNAADEAYGRGARDEFMDRFELYGGQCNSYGVLPDGSNAESVVSELLSLNENMSNHGVYVVGYGNMFLNTLNQLLAKNYPGPIGCVSTLTVPEWRPDNISENLNIVTVVPVMEKGIHLSKREQNVIFYFCKIVAYMALQALYSPGAGDDYASKFWPSAPSQYWYFDMARTIEGDSVVRLRISKSW